MENRPSIKTLIIIFAVIACALFAVSYSTLAHLFFEKGLELSVRHRLELEASAYARAYALDPDAELPSSANFRAYPGHDALPEDLRGELPPEDFPAGAFIVIKGIDQKSRGHYFLYSWTRPDGTVLYFTYSFTDEDASNEVHSTLRTGLWYMTAIGLVCFLVVVLIAALMMKKLANRIAQLNDWASRLDMDGADEPAPAFHYVELDRLAELFRRSMRRVGESVRREQRFLRNASHELRTPVATLQANLDWLDRLGAAREERFAKPLAAMRKAVHNMKELIATLLWTGRNDADTLPRATVQADRQIADILNENAYLTQNKRIRVNQRLSPLTITTPPTLARIVWSNIIRNAFQHTYEGTVDVELSGTTLTVRNDIASEAAPNETESHGLGLMLINDMVTTLGWDVRIEEAEGVYCVRVEMAGIDEEMASGGSNLEQKR